MLVLSRKVGESILIGEDITVTIVRIAAGGVRVGIEAPPELAVVRRELKDRLRAHDASPPRASGGRPADGPGRRPGDECGPSQK